MDFFAISGCLSVESCYIIKVMWDGILYYGSDRDEGIIGIL